MASLASQLKNITLFMHVHMDQVINKNFSRGLRYNLLYPFSYFQINFNPIYKMKIVIDRNRTIFSYCRLLIFSRWLAQKELILGIRFLSKYLRWRIYLYIVETLTVFFISRKFTLVRYFAETTLTQKILSWSVSISNRLLPTKLHWHSDFS